MNAHVADIHSQDVDPKALRKVLGRFPTGVTVITTIGEDGTPLGLTVNSFASVSLDPPLILWSIHRNAPSRPAFERHSAFAINIMCEASKELVLKFATPAEDKFHSVEWTPGLDGVPILDDAAATLECRTENRMEGGDHEIFLGRICRFRKTDKLPLLFHDGQFTRIGTVL